MKRSKFSDSHILSILKQAEAAGQLVPELCQDTASVQRLFINCERSLVAWMYR